MPMRLASANGVGKYQYVLHLQNCANLLTATTEVSEHIRLVNVLPGVLRRKSVQLRQRLCESASHGQHPPSNRAILAIQSSRSLAVRGSHVVCDHSLECNTAERFGEYVREVVFGRNTLRYDDFFFSEFPSIVQRYAEMFVGLVLNRVEHH